MKSHLSPDSWPVIRISDPPQVGKRMASGMDAQSVRHLCAAGRPVRRPLRVKNGRPVRVQTAPRAARGKAAPRPGRSRLRPIRAAAREHMCISMHVYRTGVRRGRQSSRRGWRSRARRGSAGETADHDGRIQCTSTVNHGHQRKVVPAPRPWRPNLGGQGFASSNLASPTKQMA
jgi:hypothetical protein